MTGRGKHPDSWDADLDWYLNVSDSACGLSSSMGAQVAQLERMGAQVNSDHESYTDWQIGFGDHASRGAFRRERECNAAWCLLLIPVRRLLVAHYCLKLPTRWKPNGASRYMPFPSGAVSELDPYTGAALFLAERAGNLDETLELCARHRCAQLAGVRRRAFTGVKRGHAAWRKARRQVYEAWAATG